ncbi:hypothetical protein CDES_14050 [Corynebacterium deserti GIMN1.010]|uniref:Uncharacterized protein n=1 Tax=Corynebacterium deserti GIMN1.010 TaxID=931089 RepID=A0A0M4CP29_9CORY|nr:hypothetical protein [Corynebacterium deserti]ALC07135.1 hypothetical protein CDES_14050 [Corynebacterium deserti GIMN1.010]
MELSPADFRKKQDDWRTAISIYRKPNGRRFTSAEMATALALQHYERATGEAQGTSWPSQLSIARRAGFTGKTTAMKTEVGKALNELIKAGFIKKLYEGEKGTAGAPAGHPATWKMTLPGESVKAIEELFPPKGHREEEARGTGREETWGMGEVDSATWDGRSDNHDREADPTGNGTLHPTGNVTLWVQGDAPLRVQGNAPLHTTSDSTSDSNLDNNPGCTNKLVPGKRTSIPKADEKPLWLKRVEEKRQKQKDNRLPAGHGQEDYVPGQIVQDWVTDN